MPGSETRQVLAAYAVGDLLELVLAGGTAGRTWKVATSQGGFFLRRRGARTSGEARLAFDHGLRAHLVARGLPTVCALKTTAGERWLRRPEGVYELYPFIAGQPFDPQARGELASAAQTLARFHLAAAAYQPAGPPEPIAQYTSLGFSAATSGRMDDPQLQRENLLAVQGLATTPEEGTLVDRFLARVEEQEHHYAGAAYAPLEGWVIHGDYTPANLLFGAEGQVVGVFDLDWAVPGARCRDVADGLYFFATLPRHLDPSDIWSLTDAAQFDPNRCAAFLRAYQEIAPLTPPELDAIPRAFAGRWISMRLEGMAKVAADQRFRFFSRQAEAPLRWLDEHWEALRRQFS
ncbi:MAG: phosphotransferase [Candidatus Latescibacteria bacterium]|nr:phosphotransferase [Candidatus Latescibacterota bacterium]